jgi:hypothetical protein
MLLQASRIKTRKVETEVKVKAKVEVEAEVEVELRLFSSFVFSPFRLPAKSFMDPWINGNPES